MSAIDVNNLRFLDGVDCDSPSRVYREDDQGRKGYRWRIHRHNRAMECGYRACDAETISSPAPVEYL
jgi:hypothetical protein